VLEEILQGLDEQGQLGGFRSVSDTLMVAIDGTEDFSSTQIGCPQCSTRTLKSGDTHYFHSIAPPVIKLSERISETSSQPPSSNGSKKPNRNKQKLPRKRGPEYTSSWYDTQWLWLD